MHIVEDPAPDVESMAQELMEPFLTWLTSVQLMPAKFTEVMRRDTSQHDEKPQALGITQEQFQEGINSLQSLHLYAEILGISKEELWGGFEVNKYIAPRWLIEQLEKSVQEQMAGG